MLKRFQFILLDQFHFFLKEEIEKALKLKGLTMGRIVQRPIDELVKYHKNLIDISVF